MMDDLHCGEGLPTAWEGSPGDIQVSAHCVCVLIALGCREYSGCVLVCHCAIFPPTRTKFFEVMMWLNQFRP